MNCRNNYSRIGLLAVLSVADRDLLAQSLEAVELDLHQVPETRNVSVPHLFRRARHGLGKL
jgi:hypothetical protein